MLDKKYQVFISSTFIDLKNERDNIIKAILEMYHIPIGMEMFSAEDEDQWEIIRRTIDISDYYILLLGLRYGSETSEGISFTQKEYEYALERKVPILAFLLDEKAPLSQDKRDNDLNKINQFRNTVLRNSKMSDFWTNCDELTKKVSIALMKQIMQKPGIGWIRGDQGISPELSEELTLLSKENRSLREKVIDLESKISPKKPILEVTINHQSELILNFTKQNIKQIDLPKKLDINTIEKHLKPFIEQKDIDEYNSNLPTQEEIDQYNIEKVTWHHINNSSQNLLFEICNSGTVKANEVFVTIKFPKEVQIVEIDEISEFKLPKYPLPSNPIAKAQQEYEKQQNKGLILGSFLSNSNILTAQLTPSYNSLARIHRLNQNYWTKLDDNTVTLKLNSLLHTRCKVFDDEYKIVPLKSGEFEVQISFICEEYEKEIVTFLPLKIIEEKL
ncbi:DUF4062 domain-containing protein [Sulfurimonas sp. HSL3-2]|uniref:DUF4062 domain-containing protein n=1 Tax=Hydrocurvibacter mobilis TaxID=3131936 RepID=UPI0031F94668